MNLTGFGLNMYLSQFVFGIIEIPAKVIMYVLVNRVGRRQSQAWALILTGLCIGANVIIPKREMLLCYMQYLLKGRFPFCAVLEKENHRSCPLAVLYGDVLHLKGICRTRLLMWASPNIWWQQMVSSHCEVASEGPVTAR